MTPELQQLERRLDQLENVKHNCIQEKDIGKILGILTNIVKEFYGNGHKGMAREFPELKGSVENLSAVLQGHTKVIADLVTFQTQLQTQNKLENEMEADSRYEKELNHREDDKKRDKTRIWITLILGVSSITVTLLVKLL